MERYDIIIIGTGPAGVSAAITARARNKNILLIGDKNLSSKVEMAHAIRNYPGLPDISGKELRRAFLHHLEKMEISVTEDKINGVYAMGEYFALRGSGTEYEASSVILAVGMSVAKPYPGELENLGQGVSYCATCDAALYRGKSAVVAATSVEEEKEAEFLAQMADKIYYVPMYQEATDLDEKIEIVRQKPVGIEKTGQRMRLVTDQGAIEADGIFLLRGQVAPSQLVPGLKVEDNHIGVDRQMRTNIKGLFACGDVTGTPYQYVKAAGEGNVAALSAVSYLADRKRQK